MSMKVNIVACRGQVTFIEYRFYRVSNIYSPSLYTLLIDVEIFEQNMHPCRIVIHLFICISIFIIRVNGEKLKERTCNIILYHAIS